MTAPILEMKGITKKFPGVTALDGVNIEVYPGEIVALAGENGAGKSTLMNVLGGIHQPDKGSILIDGHDTTIRSAWDSIAIGIGFIHQELNILDNLDIAENMYLGREPLWGGPLSLIDRGKIHQQAKVFLSRLGLSVSSRTPVRQLSIAQRQMIEIAKALSLKARILIMDEPTSSLTLTETTRLMEIARELKGQGVSIIYITHRLAEIRGLADRVVVLRDGRNAGALARQEISHDRIVKLMVGRELNRSYSRPSNKQRNAVFEVRGLRTRRYPAHTVSFQVGRGEILGLAGLVGAGRSEVAQAIFGVEKALEGTFFLDGKSIRLGAPGRAIENGIYLVPEDRRRTGLVMGLAIRENITLPALPNYSYAGWVNRNAERAVASHFCERLNIKTSSIEVRVENLSGGTQQKVVLARWMSLNPRVLIFDEPTRGIDVGAKAEIYQLIRDLAESGVGIIMISSDMEEILGESDRIAVMHEGAISGILERHEANEEAIMRLLVGEQLGGGNQQPCEGDSPPNSY